MEYTGVGGSFVRQWGSRLTILLVAGYYAHLTRNLTALYLPAIGGLIASKFGEAS